MAKTLSHYNFFLPSLSFFRSLSLFLGSPSLELFFVDVNIHHHHVDGFFSLMTTLSQAAASFQPKHRQTESNLALFPLAAAHSPTLPFILICKAAIGPFSYHDSDHSEATQNCLTADKLITLVSFRLKAKNWPCHHFNLHAWWFPPCSTTKLMSFHVMEMIDRRK